MNTKTMIKRINFKTYVAVAAAILCGAARSEEPVGTEAVAEEEESVTPIALEAGFAFDSKYLSYGFVDNKDPIATVSACATFFDHISVGFDAIYDVTKIGRKYGYTNRQNKFNEFDPYVSLDWAFSPEDYEWLPTTVEVSLGYAYEWQPNAKAKGPCRFGEDYDKSLGEDTAFWTVEVSLPDLWLVPTFAYERDVMRDDGTYLNLELAHTFAIIGEGDEAELTFTPSVAQGFGNAQRVLGYVDIDHSGLMDTTIKGELCWNVCENLSLSGYVAYSDFVFDRKMRHAAREYDCDYNGNPQWDESWNFIGGLAVKVSF